MQLHYLRVLAGRDSLSTWLLREAARIQSCRSTLPTHNSRSFASHGKSKYVPTNPHSLVPSRVTSYQKDDKIAKEISEFELLDEDLTNNTALGASESAAVVDVDHQYHQSFSDETCARLFATSAFTAPLVFQTLYSLGQTTIGPLALQALGRRCQSFAHEHASSPTNKYESLSAELLSQLSKARGLGIVPWNTKYCKLLEHLATQNNGKLLDYVLSSDMHPREYSDYSLQYRLFYESLRNDDTSEADKALSTLTCDQPAAEDRAWNILFRAHLRDPRPDRWWRISRCFDQMLANNVRFTPNTIATSYEEILRPRTTSKLPIKDHYRQNFDDLQFIVNMWVKLVDDRPYFFIGYSQWGEIIKRLGMLSRYNGLERLVDWLGVTYAKRRLLQKIFPPIRQQAIIEWYFKSLSLPPENVKSLALNLPRSSLPHIEKWARGVALVQKLKARGLHVDTWRVRRVCQVRLLMLFNAEHIPSAKHANRYAMAFNTLSLHHMVRYLQQLWKPQGTLFPIPKELLDDESEEGEHLLRTFIFNIPDRLDAREQGPVLDAFLKKHPQEISDEQSNPIVALASTYSQDALDLSDDLNEPLPFLRKLPT